MSRKSRRDNMMEQHSDIDWLAAARDCIDLYFSNKQWFCGGPVPQRLLFSDSSLQAVLYTEFDKEWEDFVHGHCLPTIPNSQHKDLGNLPWEVYNLLKILREMGNMCIPKEFRPGLTLLYFQFCKGVDCDTVCKRT